MILETYFAKIYILFTCVPVCCICICPWSAEERDEFMENGAGVRGSCESPDVGAEYKTFAEQ